MKSKEQNQERDRAGHFLPRMIQVVVKIPAELYRQLRIRAAAEGLTIREIAYALYSAYVEGRIHVEKSDL